MKNLFPSEKFDENGICIINNIILDSLIDPILENALLLYCKLSGTPRKKYALRDAWQSQILHDDLIKFRKEEKHLFSALYDGIQFSTPLNFLASNPIISENVAKVLKCKPVDLANSNHGVRMDPPVPIPEIFSNGIKSIHINGKTEAV